MIPIPLVISLQRTARLGPPFFPYPLPLLSSASTSPLFPVTFLHFCAVGIDLSVLRAQMCGFGSPTVPSCPSIDPPLVHPLALLCIFLILMMQFSFGISFAAPSSPWSFGLSGASSFPPFLCPVFLTLSFRRLVLRLPARLQRPYGHRRRIRHGLR